MEYKRRAVILMADDDEDDCMLIKEAFQANGFKGELRFVENGEQLMEYLNRRGKYEDGSLSPQPDLILLDLNMPRKDGREALNEIKSDPALRSIPVVILTTSNDEGDVVLCYNGGVSSFITKPSEFRSWNELAKTIIEYWFCFSTLPPKRRTGSGGAMAGPSRCDIAD